MLGPDFFNNASAVLPILLLTKVADRARREAAGSTPASLGSHRTFIVMALAGETGALVGAAVEATRHVIVLPLAIVILVCGLFFAWELLGADTRKLRRHVARSHEALHGAGGART